MTEREACFLRQFPHRELFTSDHQTHEGIVRGGRVLETFQGERVGRFGGRDYYPAAYGDSEELPPPPPIGGVARINEQAGYRYFQRSLEKP